jgi:MoaA/NifB/PqqE/SkfB family radical SAM enzyme
MHLNNSICSYPWRGAAIRPNGATMPCCRYEHLTDLDTVVGKADPRYSKHWVKLRDDMLAGKLIDGCKSCYQDEKNGLISMRQSSLDDYFIPINREIQPLEQLEIALSNLCNLACAHCSNYFSTKWYSEDVKAGRIKKAGVIENEFSFDQWDLSNLTELKIIGGEPFMEQKRFIELLKKLNLPNITLQICTNGTIMPNDELKLLIESCKTVYLCVSLDGVGSTNDWYRWPSKFSDVVDNMKIYESWWGEHENILPIVHHVVNAINIFELEDFVKFMTNDFPAWRVEWDWIRWPQWQELSVLPADVKNVLIYKFEWLSERVEVNQFIYIDPYKISINKLQESPNSNWNTLKKEVTKLSRERNLDFLNMVEPYKKLWNIELDNSTMCAYPWVHMATDIKGKMIICCNTYEEGYILKEDGSPWELKDNSDPLTYFNSEHFKQIRLEMLRGKKPKICQRCYDIEKSGGSSIRMATHNENNLQELIDNTDADTGELKSIQLRSVHFMWGNKCNLKCKMCHPVASNQLIDEFLKMNLISSTTEFDEINLGWEFEKNKKILEAISPYIRILNVTGGEPLINNDFLNYCKYLIDQDHAKNVDLSFHTNLTVLPEKFVSLWNKFKSVTVKISIDAVGDSYEYIRYPGKWSVVDKNIKELAKISKELSNIGIETHAVFSSFNAHAIPDLIEYMSQFDSKTFNSFPNTIQIHNPTSANPQCIPKDIKNKIYVDCMSAVDKFRPAVEHQNMFASRLDNLNANLKYMLEKDIDSSHFYNFIKMQDQFRTIDGKNIITWHKQ